MSDSQSTSSIENRSPMQRKKKRDNELLRKLNQRIAQQKQLIVQNLDNCSKSQLDIQIAVLQEMQRKYMTMKFGTNSAALSPAIEHPLQDVDSPSPVKPLRTGSTSALYSPSLQNQRLSPYNQAIYRSMPSITTGIQRIYFTKLKTNYFLSIFRQ